jgi:hypothetical protein
MLDPGRDAVARAPEHCGQGGAIRCCGRWDRAELDRVDLGAATEVHPADDGGRSQFHNLLSGRLAPVYVALDLPWPEPAPAKAGGPTCARCRSANGGRRCQGCFRRAPGACRGGLGEGWGRRLFELMVAHRLKGDRRQAHRRPLRPAHQVAQDQKPGLHAVGATY